MASFSLTNRKRGARKQSVADLAQTPWEDRNPGNCCDDNDLGTA